MDNRKDNNADLGTQTIEDTAPPIILGSDFVIPVEPTENREAADLDAQLEKLLGEEKPAEQPQEAIVTPSSEFLDAQLEAMLADENKMQPIDAQNPDLDAQLEAMLMEGEDEPPVVTEFAPDPVQNVKHDDTPIILAGPAPQTPQEIFEPAPEAKSEADSAREMMEQARQIMEQATAARKAAEQAAANRQNAFDPIYPEQSAKQPVAPPVYPTAEQPVTQQVVQPAPQSDPETLAAAESARAMMQQAQLMLQQAQAAQMQATQAAQQAQQAQIQAAQQAQMQAAQQARIQAEQQAQMQAAQAAQLQAAMQQSAQTHATTVITDPYAAKEVDRLKAELDGMRELVNKLTLSLAQNQGATAQQAQPAQQRYMPDPEYRSIESQLEILRREMKEKELRDREKEIERRQKETEENAVKDIRPEIVQMSEPRDIAPIGGNSPFGSEFMPLANGVFYSLKDKQLYVLTPVNGAAPSATERPAPAPKKKVRRAPARRPSSRRRRPSGRPSRRPRTR